MRYVIEKRHSKYMNNFLKLAKKRRSIRKFKSDPISNDALMRILEAGRCAPSGNNTQPWRFILIEDPKQRKMISAVAGEQSWIADAPVIIAVVADIRAKLKPEFRDENPSADDPKHNIVVIKAVRDATIAADHIVMAATDEGLGSCWIALFKQSEMRAALSAPDSCYVVALIPIGLANSEAVETPRHSIEEMTFSEQYGRRFSSDRLS